MNNKTTLPISWKGYGDHTGFITLYNAEFLEDFGVFKKGEKCQALNIRFDIGRIDCNDFLDNVKTQYFKNIPIDEPKNTIS